MWWTGLIEISFHVTSHQLHNITWFCRCVILHCEFLQNCSDDVIIYLKRKIKVLVRWIFVAPGNLFSSFEKFSRFFEARSSAEDWPEFDLEIIAKNYKRRDSTLTPTLKFDLRKNPKIPKPLWLEKSCTKKFDRK